MTIRELMDYLKEGIDNGTFSENSHILLRSMKYDDEEGLSEITKDSLDKLAYNDRVIVNTYNKMLKEKRELVGAKSMIAKKDKSKKKYEFFEREDDEIYLEGLEQRVEYRDMELEKMTTDWREALVIG